jgi:hypothetical protein
VSRWKRSALGVFDAGRSGTSLPAPIHVGMNSLFLSCARPRAPDRGSLLGRSDQDHAILARSSCGLQIGASQFLFVLSLLELQPGNVPLCGKAIDGLGILLADLAKGRRGGNPEVSLPTEEAAYQPDGLQVGDVGLQEDANALVLTEPINAEVTFGPNFPGGAFRSRRSLPGKGSSEVKSCAR